MTTLVQIWLIFQRAMRQSLRNPVWVIIGIVQPVLYLTLFGPLLQPLVAATPGFPPGDAYQVLVPALLVQLGMFGSLFAGFSLIQEYRTGVVERMRVTPVSRTALLLGRSMRDVVVLVVQGILLTLDSFFSKVHRIGRNEHFKFGDSTYQPIQTIHYMDGYEIVPSYGLLIDPVGPRQECFLTTDTQFCPNLLMDFYQRSRLIFHDCETYDLTGKIKSGVHAHYTELKTLPPEIRAKTWLYHYNDGALPDAKADGFAGLVAKGQSFEI